MLYSDFLELLKKRPFVREYVGGNGGGGDKWEAIIRPLPHSEF